MPGKDGSSWIESLDDEPDAKRQLAEELQHGRDYLPHGARLEGAEQDGDRSSDEHGAADEPQPGQAAKDGGLAEAGGGTDEDQPAMHTLAQPLDQARAQDDTGLGWWDIELRVQNGYGQRLIVKSGKRIIAYHKAKPRVTRSVTKVVPSLNAPVSGSTSAATSGSSRNSSLSSQRWGRRTRA